MQIYEKHRNKILNYNYNHPTYMKLNVANQFLDKIDLRLPDNETKKNQNELKYVVLENDHPTEIDKKLFKNKQRFKTRKRI